MDLPTSRGLTALIYSWVRMSCRQIVRSLRRGSHRCSQSSDACNLQGYACAACAHREVFMGFGVVLTILVFAYLLLRKPSKSSRVWCFRERVFLFLNMSFQAIQDIILDKCVRDFWKTILWSSAFWYLPIFFWVVSCGTVSNGRILKVSPMCRTWICGWGTLQKVLLPQWETPKSSVCYAKTLTYVLDIIRPFMFTDCKRCYSAFVKVAWHPEACWRLYRTHFPSDKLLQWIQREIKSWGLLALLVTARC